MAYSLRFNSRLVYYSGDATNYEGIDSLLASDRAQMVLPGQELLNQATCFKARDKRFILSTIDRNCGSREDMVSMIKAFIRSSAPGMVDEASGVTSSRTLSRSIHPSA